MLISYVCALLYTKPRYAQGMRNSSWMVILWLMQMICNTVNLKAYIKQTDFLLDIPQTSFEGIILKTHNSRIQIICTLTIMGGKFLSYILYVIKIWFIKIAILSQIFWKSATKLLYTIDTQLGSILSPQCYFLQMEF